MSKFKNASGQFFLNGLFFETTTDRTSVVYTLKDEDHLGYPSLYRLYIETLDPTEHRFAISHLGNWRHWELLCRCGWFQEYLSRWRRELLLKLQSEALARILTLAKAGGKEQFAANRYLLDYDAPHVKRGRPSKASVKEEAQRLVSEHSLVEQDFKRLATDLN